MNKEELITITDLITHAWTIDQTMESRRGMNTVWWRYLKDLERGEVASAIDRMVLADRRWPPRPGEVRRIILEGTLGAVPSGEEAWGIWRQRVKDMQSGNIISDALSSEIQRTVARIGSVAKDLNTNGDRDLFLRIYQEEYERAVAAKFAVND